MVLPAGDRSLLTIVCQQDILHLGKEKKNHKNDVIKIFCKKQIYFAHFCNNQLTSCHYYLHISVDDAKIMQKAFKKKRKIEQLKCSKSHRHDTNFTC